jgi:psp operon transcriptional activator
MDAIESTRAIPPSAGPAREAIGESEPFLAFQEKLSRAAKVDRPLLIVGERGTGKELAAARAHFLSPRWREPFLTLNCAALSPSLIESELFGYEAGAFTGATRRRQGRFESADGGTLFLDEIGNIPLEVQAKILRVVEYQSFERVGGAEPVHVDVRIIGATNADLRDMARHGQFKQDLLDRLSFEVLALPPLRDRHGDVGLLVNFFAVRMAHELGWENVPVISDSTMSKLEGYSWPGNIRELKNVVERAVYSSMEPEVNSVVFDPFPYKEKEIIAEKTPSLDPGTTNNGPDISLERPLREQVAQLEMGLLKEAMEVCRFNQREAAERLGMTYHQFRGLYRKYKDDLDL